MMLKVLFFASIREQVGCGELELEWSDSVRDIDSLQALLCSTRGQVWADALGQDNVIRALNQVVVDENAPLADGDEVAFYPPVTGG